MLKHLQRARSRVVPRATIWALCAYAATLTCAYGQGGTNLIINEFRYNVSPQGGNQFVELYNAGGTTAYLDGLILTDEAGDGLEGVFQFPGAPGEINFPVAPGAFVFIAVDAKDGTAGADWECFAGGFDSDNLAVPNLALVGGTMDLSLFTGDDNLILADGTDTVVPIDPSTFIDSVNYGSLHSELAPLGTGLPDYDADVGSGPAQSLNRCPDGVDTDLASGTDFYPLAPTPGAANSGCGALPALSINDTSVTEGNAGTVNAVFTISLSPTSAVPVIAHYFTTDLAAEEPGDYLRRIPTNTVTLAPGATATTITVAVVGDTESEGNEDFRVVLATPTNAVHADPLGIGTILDDEGAPAISIQKTVYLGHNGGLSCPGGELVQGANGQAITFCFRVTNIGGEDLTGVTITDPGITNFTPINLGTMMPAEVETRFFQTTIEGDLVNTARVTGTPSVGPIVSDTDTATVDELNASLALQKTVYLGHDGGVSAPGGEVVEGTNGAAVTYCFEVLNTGGDVLSSVTVTDANLPGFTPLNLGTVNPGQAVTGIFETSISGDLTNNATATGTPSSGPNAVDTDTAIVDEISPEVLIQKTVYAGHDGGASCPGMELITATNGSPITYCFSVTNSGDVMLANVTVSDADLPGFSATNLGVLAVGETVTLHFEAAVNGSLTNTALVTAVPPSGPAVGDMDSAAVALPVINPAVEISKTVYLGHDGGASCPGGEVVQGTNGAQITYCFEVANTGDDPLSSVTVTDTNLPGFTPLNLGTVNPGQAVTGIFETSISGDLTNHATATGTPSIGPDVMATESAIVDEIAPAVLIEKTVYAGHDGGASCPGMELVTDTNGTPVTYCFLVTNAGDTVLSDVTVMDGDLPGFATTNLGVLGVGAAVALHFESAINGSLTNSATVTGTPPSGPVVADADTAAVNLLVINPAVGISKTVYPGHDNGASIPGSGSILVTNQAAVTYCFIVTNSGDVSLSDVTVTDPLLTGFGPTNLGPVAPSGVVTAFYETAVSGSLTNIATVQGTPPFGPDVSASNSAVVIEINPALGVVKTVYLGHDGGASCPGTQYLQGTNGTPVTYCIRVINVGDTTIDAVEVSDPQLGITPFVVGTMVPAQEATFYVEDFITQDLINHAAATGLDPNGDGVIGRDSAEVDLLVPIDCIFSVTDLGTLGGLDSEAYGINNQTQVVGRAATVGGATQAVLWANGIATNLGALPGGVNSEAWDITDQGDIVGNSSLTNMVAGSPSTAHAFLHTGGGLLDLGTLGGLDSNARGISKWGNICGWANRLGDANPKAMYTTNNTMIDLGTLTAAGQLVGDSFDINAHTQVVGFAHVFALGTGLDAFRPFLFQDMDGDGTKDPGEMQSLGTLGGRNGVAHGINDSGQIVGGADISGFSPRHAFLITPESNTWFRDENIDRANDLMQDLGTLGGTYAEAWDINENGVVVGYSTTGNGEERAFIWEEGNKEDLNTLINPASGWVLNQARAINDAGDIVGFGTLSNNVRAFLLTPCGGGGGGNELEITRIFNADHDPTELTVVWNQIQVGQTFILEYMDSLMSSNWLKVPPTNQWPSAATFWTDNIASDQFYRVWRVRGVPPGP